MIKLTKDQRKAVYRVYLRDVTVAPSYRAFRRNVSPGPGCVMLPWKNMWLGIEPDGYTHS